MKNKMSDVRNHLVAMLEKLGDDDTPPEVIERAKVTAIVADKYIASIKVEIDARRLYAEHGKAMGHMDSLPALTQENP